MRELELGTPQGGVLSPTLFNVLMNIIVGTKLPRGVTITAYADDILIQAKTYCQMQKALDILGGVCDRLGFVVSTTKTKAMCTMKGVRRELMLHGDKVEYVTAYKYLGIYVGATHGKELEFQRLVTNCKSRLRPLKAMAWGGKGASVAVLRTMYLAYIRSVIDYAAPALICFGKCKLAKLETIQNEAMRVILGCPTTVKITNMRMELGLTSVSDRIREINTAIGLRTIRDERDTIPKLELLKLLDSDVIPGTNWAAATARDIIHYNIVDYNLTSQPVGHVLSPWEDSEVDLRIHRPPYKKTDMLPQELKEQYMNIIDNLATESSVIDQVYFDGSLNTDTGQAGAAVTVLSGREYCTDHETQIRLHDWASSTQSELLAILLGLKQIGRRLNNALIISDSMSALQALNSKRETYPELINTIRRKIKKIRSKRVSIQFVWVPSHIGISGNERVDRLAKDRRNM